MFQILSWTIRYIFIGLIYYFIYHIIRLIYLDIKRINERQSKQFNSPYLKLVNRKESLDFDIQEFYDLKDVITMGRKKENDIQIMDKFMSSQHAKITMDEDEYFLEDLGSINGTYLNGTQIQDVVKLKSGDRIGLGQVEFLFVKEVD
ncbi:Forkhead associated (FHA) domain, binds pSer, pThr, pTyr [Anaerovirgula multivorans]|uniref:Forkhead associated (FHA) domain, binds pSer, pThr, pTyr n=1 Tax=Anaerovirgula multivorans TaxID=312168 RepID=A0A239G5U2_9FIRM|nr:FHA domain-containing protein [Anaerovirgula multivorans]SNS64138.1 Forkhead associated (FHA) domain, binds pSer, pThr, pTyr [Anaerovirgula multivorans]